MQVESFIGQLIFILSNCTAEQIHAARTSRFPTYHKCCNSRKCNVTDTGALVVEECFFCVESTETPSELRTSTSLSEKVR